MQKYPFQHVKLIFNPSSGRSNASPALLHDVLSALQTCNFIAEVHLIDQDHPNGREPNQKLETVIREAIRRHIRLFVVCGGDGTIETVARLLIDKRVTLGIIPAGTQNNIALSLGIPAEVDKAVELLRIGMLSKIDVGIARSANVEIPFLEICSVGLFSALFQSADNLQKGDLGSISSILSTLASFPLADIHLTMEAKGGSPSLPDHEIHVKGHVALIANLPYFGLNYRLAPNSPFDDGILDVLIFTEFSKLELVGNVLQTPGDDNSDARILRYRARRISIHSEPTLPVQADGTALGNTPIEIYVKHRAISIMTGFASTHTPRWGFLRNLNIFRFLKG